MMDIVQYAIPVTTTGGAGVATGSATSEVIRGAILDIFLDFDGTAPATTDTTISYGGVGGGNIWARSDSAADALVAPRIKPVDNANAAIANAYDFFFVNGPITVTLAQCNALAPAVTVYVKVLRY